MPEPLPSSFLPLLAAVPTALSRCAGGLAGAAIVLAALEFTLPATVMAQGRPSAPPTGTGPIGTGPIGTGPIGAGATGAGPTGGAQPTAESLVRIDVVGPSEAPVPGEPFEIAVVLRIEPGWHVYWENPGDSGLATRVEAALPKGYAAGPLRFPRPKTFATEYETTYGYEGAVALFLRVTPPPVGSPEASAKPLSEIPIEIRWMVCKGVCFAGSASRTVTVPSAAIGAEITSIVEDSKRALPAAQRSSDLNVRIVTSQDRRSLRIEGAAPAGAEVSFIPKATPGVEYAAPVIERRGDRFTLTVPLEVRPGNAMGEPLRAAGLLMFGGADGRSIDIETPVAAP